MIPKKKLDWWIELTQKERCDIIIKEYDKRKRKKKSPFKMMRLI